MKRLINITVVAHKKNGDTFRCSGYADDSEMLERKYDFEINHDIAPVILKDSILSLLDDIQYNTENLNVGDITIKKGTKFHFIPGTNFPRQQFKELQNVHGVKSIRDITKADYIVCDNDIRDSAFDQKWKYGLLSSKTMTNLLHFFSETYFEDYNQILDNEARVEIQNYIDEEASFEVEYYARNAIIKVLKDLEDRNEEAVNNGEDALLTENESALLQSTMPDLQNGSRYISITSESMYKSLKEFSEDTMADKLLTTDLLSRVIDKHLDKLVIDEEQYQSLKTMFKSTDRDNHIIAMEIMANCDFKKSILYLEKLFLSYYDEMWCTSKANHVNFKNLRLLLDRGDTWTMKNGCEIDHSMQILEKYDIMTPENINFMLETHYDRLQSLINEHSKYFRIKSLTLNENCLNNINFNYIYAVEEDYIPKEIVIEDEEITVD